MTRDGAAVVQLERVEVDVEDCGSVHLMDEKYYDITEESDDSTACSFGMFMQVEGGILTMGIALQWGDIPFTVAVADRDPGADLDGYEDVAEMSFECPSGRVYLMGWSVDGGEKKVRRLPPLPAGPGRYRVRYHVRGMDEERYLPDDCYVQIWPSPQQEAVVLKSTSQCCLYLRDPEAWKAARSTANSPDGSAETDA